MKRGKSEAIIEEAAVALMKTGSICIASHSGVTFIDYFSGSLEDAEEVIRNAYKRPQQP